MQVMVKEPRIKSLQIITVTLDQQLQHYPATNGLLAAMEMSTCAVDPQLQPSDPKSLLPGCCIPPDPCRCSHQRSEP